MYAYVYRLLIEHKADVNKADYSGVTACAVREGVQECRRWRFAGVLLCAYVCM